MTYRELRNFSEMMRSLGYTRHISMENFRQPNFPLVAEVLRWLVQRYDPSADVPSDIETPQDRVFFIKAVAGFLATKAHMRLNTKKLYGADGFALKELCKVATLLYNAVKNADLSDTAAGSEVFDVSNKVWELRELRRLAVDITSRGAALHDLLSSEPQLREKRQQVLGRQMDIVDIEKSVAAAIKQVEVEIERTGVMISNVAADEANLEARMEKKQVELERNQKRLATLQTVRPAYMDEFDRLEEELQLLYEEYIQKFRSLTWLESQLENYTRVEQDRTMEAERQLRLMAERLQRETDQIVDDDDVIAGHAGNMGVDLDDSEESDDPLDDDDDEDDDDDDDEEGSQESGHPRKGVANGVIPDDDDDDNF